MMHAFLRLLVMPDHVWWGEASGFCNALPRSVASSAHMISALWSTPRRKSGPGQSSAAMCNISDL